MEELRPNDKRARYAIAMIWVILCFTVASFVLSLMAILINEGIISIGNLPSYIISLYLSSIDYWGFLMIAIYIVSIVAFIMWFRRAYYNLSLRVGDLLYGNGWAAGGWFIPFINLYMPYQIMKDMYEKTDKYLMLNMEVPYKGNLKASCVNWWWALWILAFVVSRISVKIIWNLDEINQIQANQYVTLIQIILMIALCMVTIIVIKDYNEAEELLKDEKFSDITSTRIESEHIEKGIQEP